MGKREIKKKYFMLSGLGLNDNNRGSAALGYGAFSFLVQKGFLKPDEELLKIQYVRNPFKRRFEVEELNIQGNSWKKRTVYQKKEVHVYLIPHSYRYGDPEPSNDDMVACEQPYNRLESKDNVLSDQGCMRILLRFIQVCLFLD